MGWFLNKRFSIGPKWFRFGISLTDKGIKPTARIFWWTYRQNKSRRR